MGKRQMENLAVLQRLLYGNEDKGRKAPHLPSDISMPSIHCRKSLCTATYKVTLVTITITVTRMRKHRYLVLQQRNAYAIGTMRFKQ